MLTCLVQRPRPTLDGLPSELKRVIVDLLLGDDAPTLSAFDCFYVSLISLLLINDGADADVRQPRTNAANKVLRAKLSKLLLVNRAFHDFVSFDPVVRCLRVH